MAKLPGWYHKQLQEAAHVESHFEKLETAVRNYLRAVREKKDFTCSNSDQRVLDKLTDAIPVFEKAICNTLEMQSAYRTLDQIKKQL